MALQRQKWSLNALATEFDLNIRTVARLLQDIPPCGTERGHPVWRLADAAPALVGGGRQPAGGTIDEAERRKTMAEATLAELKVAEKQAVMMDVREVQSELDRAFAAIRAKLLSIPSKLAPVVMPSDPAKAQRLLEAQIRETLIELQQLGEDDQPPADEASPVPDLGDATRPLPPAAEAEPVRMGRRKP